MNRFQLGLIFLGSLENLYFITIVSLFLIRKVVRPYVLYCKYRTQKKTEEYLEGEFTLLVRTSIEATTVLYGYKTT